MDGDYNARASYFPDGKDIVLVHGNNGVFHIGTKKLKNIGSDLGGAVRGFKDGLKEGNKEEGLSSIEGKETKDLSESDTFTVQAREKILSSSKITIGVD